MAEIQHSQIRAKLLELIAPSIDKTDLAPYAAADREAHLLSRCVAATALTIVADIDAKISASSIVDGGDDNGIDAIYYDQQTKTLFLVQSKWSNSHNSSIKSGEILKFLQGVQDLASLKKDRFNKKVILKWNLIEDALAKLTSVRVLVAYPGSGKIDDDIKFKIDDFIRSQNDTSELFFFQAITQREMFAYFVQEAAPPHIDLTIRLSHYGLVEHPLKAVYGQVSASDIALWYKTHGNHLFSGNIRHFLGIRSDVNSGIASTLTNDPSVFWFFNNGITLIAEGLTRQAIGGNDRSIGVFECKNVTIVNGAQTVGTIGRTLTITDSPAFLHARIIVVDDPASDLGKRITRASNTQNRIDSRNFVALDPEQDRIRTELLIDKVYYEFREGEPLEKTVEGFEFIEAITTLACASTEMSYVALAKGYVGGLYADITTTPYRALFNSSTSSKRLWSLIKLSRKIDAAIREIHDPSSAERGIVVHGNRFLLHCTLREIFKSKTTSESDTMPADEIKECAGKILRLTKSAIEGNFPDAYLAPFFKNVSKCSEIRAVIESVNLPLIN